MRRSGPYVLVHGAGHGAWCWRQVAQRLRASGAEVFTPTLTGLGERRHLLSGTIGLETFVDDILNVIAAEELENIVLVGHSFAGLPVSIVADRHPGHIAQLIYLDALIAPHGASAFDMLPGEFAATRRDQAEMLQGTWVLPTVDPAKLGITSQREADWVRRQCTPHPLKTYEDKVTLRNPVGNGLPVTYIACTDPPYANLDATRNWARAQSAWQWRELATGHDPMVTAPTELTNLLIELAEAELSDAA